MGTAGLELLQGCCKDQGTRTSQSQDRKSALLLPTAVLSFRTAARLDYSLCSRNQPSQKALRGLWLHRGIVGRQVRLGLGWSVRGLVAKDRRHT